jgi:uncharacterized integral membrane protein
MFALQSPISSSSSSSHHRPTVYEISTFSHSLEFLDRHSSLVNRQSFHITIIIIIIIIVIIVIFIVITRCVLMSLSLFGGWLESCVVVAVWLAVIPEQKW